MLLEKLKTSILNLIIVVNTAVEHVAKFCEKRVLVIYQ